MRAIFARYGIIEFKDFQSHKAATDYLNKWEADGDLLAIGVYDNIEKVFYVAKSFLPLGESDKDFNGFIDGLKQQGMEVSKVEFYGSDE